MKEKTVTRITDFGIVFIASVSIPLNIVIYFALASSPQLLVRLIPPLLSVAVVFLAIFRKKINLKLKTHIFVLLLFFTGCFALLLGLLDMASLWFVVAIIFSVFVSEKNEPVYLFLVSFVLIFIVGIFMISGSDYIPLKYGFKNCSFPCVSIRIVNFLILGFLVYYILKIFVETMVLYVDELQEKYKILEKLHLALEREISEKNKNKELRENLDFKEKELQYKKQELTKTTIKLIKFNRVLNEIKNSVVKNKTEDTLKIISNNLNSNFNWQKFQVSFNEIYPSFIHNLKSQYPDLTENEIRLASFLIMKLKTREIAEIMTISVASVSKYRNRLRKKLNLEKGTDLFSHLIQFA